VSSVVSLLARYDAMDRALVAAGFPPTSPWWRAQLARFLESGRRRWVLRVGRRGGKSTTLCRVAVLLALWGSWSVPPGDLAVIPFVSVDRDEAGARLRTIADILSALGVPFDERGDEIELRGRRLVFRVVTSSVRGTVGFTSVAVFADECARWESREAAANPAREVMASLRPTMATQPSAFEVCSSSPWGVEDYHHELFEQGDTEHQVTSFAPTWLANPTLSEARTRELEPEVRIWSREYAAVPGSTLATALDPEAVTAAQRMAPTELTVMAPIVSLDFSSGRGDATVWTRIAWAHQPQVPQFLAERCYTGFRDRGGEPIYEWRPILSEKGERQPNPDYRPTPPLLLVGPIQSIVGSFWQSVSSDELVARIAADARSWGASWCIGDQASSYALESAFARQGVRFLGIPWTQPNKAAAVERIRRWLRDRQIILPLPSSSDAARRLDSELRRFQERLLPSGVATYSARNGEHDDHVASALVTPAIADALGHLPLAPFGPRRFVPDYDAIGRHLAGEDPAYSGYLENFGKP
jgi:hypothetical protein